MAERETAAKKEEVNLLKKANREALFRLKVLTLRLHLVRLVLFRLRVAVIGHRVITLRLDLVRPAETRGEHS